MKEYNIKIIGLAMMLNCSAESINNWYNWKSKNEEHELAKLLPEYKLVGNTRYWCSDDVYKIAEFIALLPKGNSKNSVHIVDSKKEN